MTQKPSPDVIVSVKRVVMTIDPEPHPYHVQYDQDAMVAWARQVSENPALFNGLVMLDRNLIIEDDALIGVSHLVPYSTFTHWLGSGEQAHIGAHDIWHLFPIGLIVSNDGAVIVGEMGPKTFNAGQIYAPSGSVDQSDIIDGVSDLDGNILREIGEETGLDLANAKIDDKFHIFVDKRRVVPVKICRFDLSADQLIAQINQFMTTDTDEELSRILAVRGLDDINEHFAPHMLPILKWFFSDK